MSPSIRIRCADRLAHRTGVALTALFLITSLAACGNSKPRLGDTIRNQGVELTAIGDQWSEGDDLLEDGQDMITKGQKMISKGEDLVEEGQDNVKRGKLLKQQAENTYRQRTGQELPIE